MKQEDSGPLTEPTEGAYFLESGMFLSTTPRNRWFWRPWERTEYVCAFGFGVGLRVGGEWLVSVSALRWRCAFGRHGPRKILRIASVGTAASSITVEDA